MYLYDLKDLVLNYLKIKRGKLEMDTKSLILVRGIPGAGKSTFGSLITEHQGTLIDLDHCLYKDVTDEEVLYEELDLDTCQKDCRRRCEMSMVKRHKLIVVCNPFVQDWELEPYMELARRFGYRVFSIVVEQRHDDVVECDVPEEIIDKMYDRFSIRL